MTFIEAARRHVEARDADPPAPPGNPLLPKPVPL